jgi:cytosine permease
VGAMAAEYLKSRGAWPGPRRGVNLAGVVAWALGFAVGLIPTFGEAMGSPRWQRVQPASVLAFLVAFVAYSVLSRFGLEPGPLAAATPVDAPAETPAAGPVADSG